MHGHENDLSRNPQFKLGHRARDEPSAAQAIGLYLVACWELRCVELHIGAKGGKKPSTTMSIEIVRLYAFAAPGSPLAQHRSLILTEDSGFNSAEGWF